MTPEVAIVGDIAFNHDITPKGEKVSLGGAVYYSAIGAAAYSEKVGAVARVGKDFPINMLQNKGVDITGVERVENGLTCQFKVIQKPDNKREFEAIRGVAGEVNINIFPGQYLNAQYIHLATQKPLHAIIWLDRLDHKLVSVDTFEAFIKKFPGLTREMVNKASMVFANESEFEELKQLGGVAFNKPVILKRGKDGAVYMHGDTRLSVPAPKVDVVDTTGAGDVLAGAFLALRAQGRSVQEALTKAVQTASYAVQEFGVENIIPKYAEKLPEKRVTAAMVINQKGEVFLGKAPKFDNKWILPGGHIEKGETPKMSAIREIQEELGVGVDNVSLIQETRNFAPEYKGTGARFHVWRFVAYCDGRPVTINNEYSEYIFIDPRKALRMKDLHQTAYDHIKAFYKS